MSISDETVQRLKKLGMHKAVEVLAPPSDAEPSVVSVIESEGWRIVKCVDAPPSESQFADPKILGRVFLIRRKFSLFKPKTWRKHRAFVFTVEQVVRSGVTVPQSAIDYILDCFESDMSNFGAARSSFFVLGIHESRRSYLVRVCARTKYMTCATSWPFSMSQR